MTLDIINCIIEEKYGTEFIGGRNMKAIKKLLAITLTLAMVLSVAPTIATPIKAGDGTDLKAITNGTNADGSVYLTKPMTIKMSDLINESVVDTDFENRVNKGKAHLQVEVYKTKLDYNSRVRRENMTYKNGVFTFYPNQKDKGKYYLIYVDDMGGTNLNDSNWWLVKGCEFRIDSGPSINSVSYSGKALLTKTFNVSTTGDTASYSIKEDGYKDVYHADCYMRLYRNGTAVATVKVSGSEAVFKNVAVTYGKNTTFKAELLMRIPGIDDIKGPSYSFTFKGGSIPKIKAYATKINKKKVFLRWEALGGISGYYVYMGKKLVKKVSAKKNHAAISKKKAGKSKFRIAPYLKVGKTTYKGTSNIAKPKKNQYKWSRNLNVKTYGYATCKFVVTKISLKGKTYTVTGYALNNRVFDVKKYKSLKIALKVDGKKAFSKKFKNKKLKIKDYKKKKFTFKIKGKAGKDLAWGVKSLTVLEDADWGIKNDSFKN